MKFAAIFVILAFAMIGCSGGDGPVEAKDAPVATGAVEGGQVNPEVAGAKGDAGGTRSAPANAPGAGRTGGAPPPPL